jgi:hypothetical protein
MKRIVKSGTMSLNNFTLIILTFKNNVAKLYLHSLHCSGEINNNVLKYRLLLDWQAVHSRRAATLEIVTELSNRNYSEFSAERVFSHVYF